MQRNKRSLFSKVYEAFQTEMKCAIDYIRMF